MNFLIEDPMSSTDDSSLSRPHSKDYCGDSSFSSDTEDASWDMLNSEYQSQGQPDESVDTIEGDGNESGNLTLEENEDLEDAEEEEPFKCLSKFYQFFSSKPWYVQYLIILATSAILYHPLNMVYWELKIRSMTGAPNNLPSDPHYFELHNKVCKGTLERAQVALQNCLTAATKYDNNKYANTCYRDYENTINQHQEFCNWDKNALIRGTYSFSMAQFAEAGGEKLEQFIEFLNNHELNLEGAQKVLYQVKEGTIYVLQETGEGLCHFSEYLDGLGVNKEHALKLSEDILDKSIKGSQFVVDGGRNLAQQGIDFVKDIDREKIKQYFEGKLEAIQSLF